MPTKKVTVKETVAPAKTARAAKPKTPRVPSARHSKIKSSEVIEMAAPKAMPSQEIGQEVIAKLAYSYWESRGRQEGDPLQDWLRAEEEFRNSHAAA